MKQKSGDLQIWREIHIRACLDWSSGAGRTSLRDIHLREDGSARVLVCVLCVRVRVWALDCCSCPSKGHMRNRLGFLTANPCRQGSSSQRRWVSSCSDPPLSQPSLARHHVHVRTHVPKPLLNSDFVTALAIKSHGCHSAPSSQQLQVRYQFWIRVSQNGKNHNNVQICSYIFFWLHSHFKAETLHRPPFCWVGISFGKAYFDSIKLWDSPVITWPQRLWLDVETNSLKTGNSQKISKTSAGQTSGINL